MAKADQLKALIRSHAEGDDARFYAIAMQVAAQEARGGRGRLAQDLRELVIGRRPTLDKLSRPLAGPVPLAQPRGELAGLLVAEYPKTGWSTWFCPTGPRPDFSA